MSDWWPRGLYEGLRIRNDIEVTDPFHEDGGWAFLSSPKVHIRIWDSWIAFGVRDAFCKWGNSTDFIMYYPDRNFNEEDANSILEYVHHLVDQKKFDEDWGREMEFSIRQAKQYWKRKKHEEEQSIHIG